MSEDIPSWFSWFRDLGAFLTSVPNVGQGQNAMRILISAPNVDFAAWALTAGSLSVEKKPNRIPVFGEKVVSWINGRMHDAVLKPGQGNAQYRLGSVAIAKGYEFPFAFVPNTAPEGRSPRKIDDEEKELLRQAWGSENRKVWHKKYAEKCILPSTLVGQRTEQLEQLKFLLQHRSNWFTDEEYALLLEDSMQVTNPNKFGMFPFTVLSPGIAGPRPWLREMESRLVICSSFAGHRGLSRYFQQGSPRVILVDRRSSGSLDAHSFIQDKLQASEMHPQLNFRKSPEGIHIAVFSERVLEDPGLEEATEDFEEFEL